MSHIELLVDTQTRKGNCIYRQFFKRCGHKNLKTNLLFHIKVIMMKRKVK